MGIDALAHECSVLCISSSGPDPTHVGQGLREGLVSHPDDAEALFGRHYPFTTFRANCGLFIYTETCCHRHKGRYLTPRMASALGMGACICLYIHMYIYTDIFYI